MLALDLSSDFATALLGQSLITAGAFQFFGKHKVSWRMLNKGEEGIIRRKGRAGGHWREAGRDEKETGRSG
jgi:hypothetical protein